MQSLYQALPRAVRIDGKEYALRTDFRTALRILAAFEDESLAPFEQQGILLQLLYAQMPPDPATAVRLGLRFLNCGAPEGSDTQQESPARLFSLTQDAPLIYAAMRRSHGVDILEGPMHWYRFVALFSDLSEHTFFTRIVALRRGSLLGTLTKEERKAAVALQRWMRLPEAPLSEDEQAFFAQLQGAQACECKQGAAQCAAPKQQEECP